MSATDAWAPPITSFFAKLAPAAIAIALAPLELPGNLAPDILQSPRAPPPA